MKEVCWLILGQVMEGQESVQVFSGDKSPDKHHLFFTLPAGLELAGTVSNTLH